jgi:hypothetical protein
MSTVALSPPETSSGAILKPPDGVVIFLSHKAEDKKAAEEIKEILKVYSDRLQCFLFEEQGVAQEYRLQIKEQLNAADWLLLLYTCPGATWDWCFFEAGFFSALMDKDKHRKLVCLHDPAVVPPHPIENLTTVRADCESVVAMLVELFGKPVRPDIRPLHERWAKDTEYRGNREECAKRICEAVQGTKIITTLFTNCFKVILKPAQVDQLVATGKLAGEVEVETDDRALALFDLQSGFEERLTWARIATRLQEIEAVAWMNHVVAALRAACKGRTPPVLLPVLYSPTQRHYYRPILYRLDYMPARSHTFKILLTELRQEDDPRPTNDPVLAQAIGLVETGKVFRWGVIDRYLNLFSEWRIRAQRRQPVSDEEITSELECLPWVMVQIENDARYTGITGLEQVRRIFKTDAELNAFLELAGNWRRLRDAMDTAIAESIRNKDWTKVQDVLLEMRALNKDALVMVSQKQHDLFAAM